MKIPPRLYRQAIDLFDKMDRAYAAVSGASGFICSGCKDNCCMTRFHHHTLLEYLYLKTGLAQMAPGQLARIENRAESAWAQMAEMEPSRSPVRVMCPLNENGRCILYTHRPMICRLHGIAHKLHRPGGRVQTGPGCDAFHTQCGPSPDHHLDRTPLYVAMAQLERQLRTALGFDRKIKLTIAQIILAPKDPLTPVKNNEIHRRKP